MRNFENPVRSMLARLRPLPKPEVEAEKFMGGLHTMTRNQITEVVKLVISEAKKSRGFGLYINSELLGREEAFFLLVIDKFGGAGPMARNHSFEDVWRESSEAMHRLFDKDSRRFFQVFSRADDGGSKNRYSLHLESVLSSILLAAYNDLLPL